MRSWGATEEPRLSNKFHLSSDLLQHTEKCKSNLKSNSQVITWLISRLHNVLMQHLRLIRQLFLNFYFPESFELRHSGKWNKDSFCLLSLSLLWWWSEFKRTECSVSPCGFPVPTQQKNFVLFCVSAAVLLCEQYSGYFALFCVLMDCK